MAPTAAAPPHRYRISEVARLTGFTPTALRYYESAGVLAPAARTPAGYRVYDDRDVERLRLIARAKDLGCTLDEIGGLVEAWDADECGPVKHRLRSLVGGKLTEVRRHIAGQVALAAQLAATADELGGRPVDGPCDDGCGCSTATPEAGTDEGVPSAMLCSLDPDDTAARVTAWRGLLAGVRERHAVAGGVRLEFGAAPPLAELAGLVAAEHDCCPFFSFALTVDRGGVVLEVTAPPDHRPLVDAVFGPVPDPGQGRRGGSALRASSSAISGNQSPAAGSTIPHSGSTVSPAGPSPRVHSPSDSPGILTQR